MRTKRSQCFKFVLNNSKKHVFAGVNRHTVKSGQLSTFKHCAIWPEVFNNCHTIATELCLLKKKCIYYIKSTRQMRMLKLLFQPG